MAIITEDYVSFETAKLLKEKGFDKNYPLIPCYREDNGEFIDIPTTLDTINYCFIPAPTLQMAMKWLRKAHGIDIIIEISDPSVKNRKYYCMIWDGNNKAHILDLFNSYEETCEEAIKYCLENLI